MIWAELCHEAIRLTALLAEHLAGNQPRSHALLALMLLNGARLPARVDRGESEDDAGGMDVFVADRVHATAPSHSLNYSMR